MGSVEEEELERQLRFQMEETIYEVMPWNDGHFRFEERAELISAAAAGPGARRIPADGGRAAHR
jgi:hypothetical protein